MKTINNSIWILYKSFFDAVPGQKGLLAIGLLLMGLGYFQQDTNNAGVSVLAGCAFLISFTLLFAGPHFRHLASFRRHRLVPNFRKYLIISYLIALASLSVVVLIALKLVDKQNLVPLIQLRDIPIEILGLSIFSMVLITSLFGFLPGYLRYPLWFLLIIAGANIKQSSALPINLLLLSVIGVAILGLCCFIYFLGIIKKPIFYTKKAVSLSKYLPGLNGGFQQHGVTAAGSILLGMSDGNTSRFFRAFFVAFFIPIALASSALLTHKYSTEQVFQNPLFLFMGLMTAVMVQLHFAFTVSARRRFIWLRIGGNRRQINQFAQKVLARERWVMVFYYGLWCVPVISFYPKTAVWLLGVGSLLWFMILFLEQLILTFKGQLNQRVEFYLLLILLSIVSSMIALTHIHQQPLILWFGVGIIASLYSALKLWLKAQYER